MFGSITVGFLMYLFTGLDNVKRKLGDEEGIWASAIGFEMQHAMVYQLSLSPKPDYLLGI